MSAKKKYTLFASTSAAGQLAPCAFFASPAGCRNGDKCKFSHETPSTKRERSPSVVSSESEDESVAPPPPKAPVAKKKKEKKQPVVKETPPPPKESILKKKEKKEPVVNPPASEGKNSAKKQEPKQKKSRRSGESDIFAKKKEPLSSESSRPAKKARKSQDGPGPGTPKEAKKQAPPPVALPTTPKAKINPTSAKKAKSEPKSRSVPDFRKMKLPIASFSIPGFEGLKGESPAAEEETPSDVEETHAHPLPKSTLMGRKWVEAVIKTRAHPRHDAAYDFDKMKAQDDSNGAATASEWITAKPFGDWCKDFPQSIAMDCEMCETQDPVTGSKNHRALCRISIVNGDDPKDVLLDTLVKPAWPVTNYRTWVNGIEKQHLENVQFTIRHAQAFMMALCSEETVMIGHAVNNDLAAIRMVHHCNADSSFLFTVKDEPGATPSLKDVTKTVMQQDMPNTHDSVNDALMSFRCLEAWLEKGGDVEPIERSASTKNKNATSQLFLHRIPKVCQSTHLETLFLNHTSIQPVKIDDIEFSGDFGKTVVHFASPRHANLAFFTLEGEEDPDASGRLQKKVFLRSGGYMRVRKMVHERGNKKQSGTTPTKEKN